MNAFRSLAIVLAAAIAMATKAPACAGTYREGDTFFTRTESAVIVWDAEHKVEHFIRSADFGGKGQDFGFLVPTPTEPTLSEANFHAFFRLQQLVGGIERGGGSLGGGKPSGEAVQVIKQEKVSGFDAAVLKASSAKALDAWLQRNGYPSRPELVVWLGPYVQMGWLLTAFKIDRKEGSTAVATSPVCMSFKTRQPYYPYREPTDAAQARGKEGRGLRLYFLARTEARGRLYDKSSSRPWGAELRGSGPVPEKQREALAQDLGIKPKDFPKDMVVTSFLDHTIQRPDMELTFDAKAEDRRSAPGSGVWMLLASPLVLLRRRRRAPWLR